MGKKRNSPSNVLRFFHALWPTIPDGAFVEVRGFLGKQVDHEWVNSPMEYRDLVVKSPQGANIYHGVALRTHGGKSKDTVVGTHALWAEVDTEKLGYDTDEVIKLVHALPTNIRPSACVSSGHGLHFYWFLDHFEDDVSLIEKCNMVCRDLVSGDNVWNADRIMRSPGSTNNKGTPKPCEIVWCYYWCRFRIEPLTTDILSFDKVLWLGSDEVASFIPTEEAEEYMEERKLNEKDAVRITDEDRRKSTNARGELVWNKTKYHGGPGYYGLDEAIMLYTAGEYCRARWDEVEDRDKAMDGIVERTLTHVKRVWERDAGNENWDWRQEREGIRRKLVRWAQKWDGGLKAKSKAAKHGSVTKQSPRLPDKISGKDRAGRKEAAGPRRRSV